MALVRLSFDVNGEKQVSRAFDAYAHEVADMSTPLRRIGESLLEAVRRQFETQGASGSGTPWRRLSTAYALWKRQHFPGEPILVATGGMRADVLSPRSVHVTRDRLVYEPESEVAFYHQAGRGHNPQRKIVDLNAGDRRGFERVFAHWLTEVRRGAIGVSR